MVWIINAKVAGDKKELDARLKCIKELTNDTGISWQKFPADGNYVLYYYCISNEGLNGTFITAHNSEVYSLCRFPIASAKDFVVANTCVWEQDYDQRILREIKTYSNHTQLWYAKQKTEIFRGLIARKSNLIENVGNFGFMTSKSERLLYKNRDKGLMEAIRCSFDQIESDKRVEEKSHES